jgi:thiol-disulfide isomerase/thioredoxin
MQIILLFLLSLYPDVVPIGYHPPLLDSVSYGELFVRVERKFPFNKNWFKYNNQYYFSPEKKGTGMDYLIRSEGINNKGIFFESRQDTSFYWIDDNAHTISKRPMDWETNRSHFQGEDFFSMWLFSSVEKPLQSSTQLRDTTISSLKYRYFNDIDKDSVERFYYLDPGDLSIRRQETYSILRGDTSITIAELQYVKEHTAEEFRKICSDTIAKYSKDFTWKQPQVKPEPPQLNTLIGNKFLDYVLASADGKNFTVKDISSEYILLDFSYNGCMPCHQAIPVLKDIEKKYSSKGLKVIGVDPVDEFSDIDYAINKYSISYPVYRILTKKDQLAKIGITGYPTFLLLDKDRVIREIADGYNEGLYDSLSKKIDILISSK